MLAGVWHVSYTGNGHVKLLINMRDITLDDIFIHREEAKIPCNLTASKERSREPRSGVANGQH